MTHIKLIHDSFFLYDQFFFRIHQLLVMGSIQKSFKDNEFMREWSNHRHNDANRNPFFFFFFTKPYPYMHIFMKNNCVLKINLFQSMA